MNICVWDTCARCCTAPWAAARRLRCTREQKTAFYLHRPLRESRVPVDPREFSGVLDGHYGETIMPCCYWSHALHRAFTLHVVTLWSVASILPDVRCESAVRAPAMYLPEYSLLMNALLLHAVPYTEPGGPILATLLLNC